MTSRSDTERLHRNQPQEVLQAKLAARSLAGLVTEAVAERNKLLHAVEDFNAADSEGILVAWDQRVLGKLDEQRRHVSDGPARGGVPLETSATGRLFILACVFAMARYVFWFLLINVVSSFRAACLQL